MSVQVLLEDKIKKIMEDNPESKKSGKDEFEVAVAHILNIRYLTGLDFDDLLEGIIGNGGDEGIDMCYLFINDFLVKEFDETQIGKSSTIRLEIIQAKRENGFSTNGFDLQCQGVVEIFTLKSKEFKAIGANKDLIKKAQLIRDVFRNAMVKGAEFKLRVHYATKGDTEKIASKISFHQNKLCTDLKWAFKEIDFEFFGAQELNELALKKEEKINIEFTETPIDLSEKRSNVKGFAGFVTGQSLIKSLTDKNNRFKEELTEGNVRFFLGEDIGINMSIIQTALSADADKFWAMNNGITIIGDRVSPLDKITKVIENPQIVNGCQTTHCLYEAFKKGGYALDSNLKIFVKLVETDDPDLQQDIISATNSQNKVATASLKANDDIQKNIEEHLRKHNIFYERRKNFYKRKGKSGLSVLSLEKMAQVMHTVFRKEAIRAVNHTKDLFSSEDEDLYSKIFNKSADLDAYLFASRLYQKLWSLKNSDLRTNDYDQETKELKSKSLFCLLHIISSLLFNRVDKIDITQPVRHNIFSKEKKSLFKKLDDTKKLQKIYDAASAIFLTCADMYGANTKKVKNTLFKARTFDFEYIVPHLKIKLGGK